MGPEKEGYALNKRARNIFRGAGFEVRSQFDEGGEEEVLLKAGKKRTIDVTAVWKESNLKIAVNCRARKKLPEPITAYVHDWSEIRTASKADKVLFVITKEMVVKEDKQYILENDMALWTEKQLDYYEVLVRTTGEFAKYEIVHSLGLRTEEEKDTHHVLSLKFSQPTMDSQSDLFVFPMTAERLLKTAVIYRRAVEDKNAYQRILKKRRLPGIGKYLSKEESLLPTDIVVALGAKVSFDKVKLSSPISDYQGQQLLLSRERAAELVRLNIPMEYASLEVIDGQHRIFGFIKTKKNVRDNFNLLIVGLKEKGKEMPTNRKRDLFVSINDTHKRMDANLVAYLKYTDSETECRRDPELMAINIVVKLNEISPFKNRIRLLDLVKGEHITLKGLSGYDLRILVGPRGTLRKYYPNNKSEEYVKVLKLYFSVISSIFMKEWNDPEKFIIATNRGITAFLKLLRQLLITTKGNLNKENVKKYISPLKDFNWLTKDLKGVYVGTAGWRRFYDDLAEIIRKEHPKFGSPLY